MRRLPARGNLPAGCSTPRSSRRAVFERGDHPRQTKITNDLKKHAPCTNGITPAAAQSATQRPAPLTTRWNHLPARGPNAAFPRRDHPRSVFGRPRTFPARRDSPHSQPTHNCRRRRLPQAPEDHPGTLSRTRRVLPHAGGDHPASTRLRTAPRLAERTKRGACTASPHEETRRGPAPLGQ